MFIIQHKTYGEGKVISKEMKGGDIIITAQFGEDKQCTFAAESFRMGAVKADGTLKAEIDAVIAAKQAAEEARKNAVRVASVVSPKPVRMKTSGKDKKRWIPSSLLAVAYEKYLIDNGYKLESDVGNPSTVYSYGNAVEKIISREGLTWDALANNIDNVVTKYDKGGVHESFGEKSNKTYINALKRFQESLSLK